jgi:hypothetical protein
MNWEMLLSYPFDCVPDLPCTVAAFQEAPPEAPPAMSPYIAMEVRPLILSIPDFGVLMHLLVVSSYIASCE